MTNGCVFVQGIQVSSICTEFQNKKDLKTTLRAFENNINQIIGNNGFLGQIKYLSGWRADSVLQGEEEKNKRSLLLDGRLMIS
jgi:hypothetical protein